MKFIKNILLIAAMSLPFLVSCSEEKELDLDTNSMIELSEEAIVAGPEGGEFSITVTSSEDWRIAGFCDWISLESDTGKTGSELKLNVLPNEDREVKTAEFKVFAGSASKTLTITSNSSMFIELASTEPINVHSGESGFSIGVKTSCPELEVSFTDGAEAWVENTGMKEGIAGKNIYEFKVKKTDKYKSRSAKVVFKQKGGELKAEVALVQAQMDAALIVEGPKIVKGIEAVDFELNVKSNVEFEYTLPAWIHEVSKKTSEKDEEGLATTTFKLHCDATISSRSCVVEFSKRFGSYSAVLNSVFIKQQNPNPIYVTIPDKSLRDDLIRREWVILEEQETGKCEVIAKGLEGTELTIGGQNYWNLVAFSSFEGLDKFPKLTNLTIQYVSSKNIDVSSLKNLTAFKLMTCVDVVNCNLGDNPVKDFIFAGDPDNGHQRQKAITISGSQVENFDFSASSYYVGYYEVLESIDVTGMPNLKTMKAKRVAPSYWGEPTPSRNFKTIYMTQAQKDVVKVDMFKDMQIVVK